MNTYFQKIKPDFWSRDVDIFWSTNRHFMEKLSFKSNLPKEFLHRLSLQSYSGYLSESILTNTRNKLLVPLVKRGRVNKGYGTRFCPKCLEEDPEPYFRKHWRLSFVTTCTQHNCFLQDTCPKCSTPVTPYKLQEKYDFGKCHYCNESLYHDNQVERIPTESYGMIAQKNLLNILHTGMFIFEGNQYISLAYFPVLKQISKLIYNFNFRRIVLDHEILNKTIQLPSFKDKPYILVEDLPIPSQYLIYSAAEHLLKSSQLFNQFCKEHQLGKGTLSHSMPYIPYWFTHILNQNDNSFYSISTAEAESAIIYLKKNKIPITFSNLSKLVVKRGVKLGSFS